MKPVLLAGCLLLAPAGDVFAAPILFPADSGVVNVRDYGAKGDGVTDDTAAIQEAFNRNAGNGSVIYLPPGEYLISDTIRWPGRQSFNILQGAGQAHTTLRLMDNAPGFDNPAKPKNMIWTGGPPAQRFKTAVRDLTIDCGRGNPGAVGLNFCANNQGTARDLTIRAGPDGRQPGAVGLALDEAEVGPLLVKNVTVIGFDLGVRVRHTVNSVTIEGLALRGQRVAGLDNFNNYVFLGQLDSENDVPAIVNDGPDGIVNVVDSRITGTGKAAERVALENRHPRATLFVRNVAVTGYRAAIQDAGGERIETGHVTEWVSDPPIGLFPGELRTLNLPVAETPTVPHDPLEQWISPAKFGGLPADGDDDTAAIQAAIDSGATTVYLPRGKENNNPNDPGRHGAYLISDTIFIRGNVRRIVGLEASLEVTDALAKQPDKPVFVFENGAPPVVVLERLRFTFKRFPNPALVHRADRDLVVSSFSELSRPRHEGTGRLFLEDTVGPAVYVGPGARLYARQLNIEGGEWKLVNDGGTVWVLGLKTECRGPIALTKTGGVTEIIGGHLYKCVEQGADQLAFEVQDGGKLSLAGVAEYTWNPKFATVPIVQETRAGETRRLTKHDLPEHGNAALLPLLTAFPTPVGDEKPPTAPTVTLLEQTDSSLTLGFAGDGDVAGFIVRSGATALGRHRRQFTHTGLQPETEYRYEVIAYNRFNQPSPATEFTARTTPDVTPPTPPGNLRALHVTDRRVELIWQPSRDTIGVTGYLIERQLAGAAEPAVELARTVNTEFVDNAVTPGNRYVYRVIALDQAGNRSEPATLEVAALDHPPRRLQQEAERFHDYAGDVQRSWFVFNLHGGCWLRYRNLELGRDKPFDQVSIRYGTPNDRAGAIIEVVVDPVIEGDGKKRRVTGGETVARFVVQGTGGWEKFETFTLPAALSKGGERDVALVIHRGDSKHGNALVNIDWFSFQYAY